MAYHRCEIANSFILPEKDAETKTIAGLRWPKALEIKLPEVDVAFKLRAKALGIDIELTETRFEGSINGIDRLYGVGQEGHEARKVGEKRLSSDALVHFRRSFGLLLPIMRTDLLTMEELNDLPGPSKNAYQCYLTEIAREAVKKDYIGNQKIFEDITDGKTIGFGVLPSMKALYGDGGKEVAQAILNLAQAYGRSISHKSDIDAIFEKTAMSAAAANMRLLGYSTIPVTKSNADDVERACNVTKYGMREVKKTEGKRQVLTYSGRYDVPISIVPPTIKKSRDSSILSPPQREELTSILKTACAIRLPAGMEPISTLANAEDRRAKLKKKLEQKQKVFSELEAALDARVASVRRAVTARGKPSDKEQNTAWFLEEVEKLRPGWKDAIDDKIATLRAELEKQDIPTFVGELFKPK